MSSEYDRTAAIGSKIAIVGSPGAGKSTFARNLGDILGIKVHHLDSYFWKSRWHELPRIERIKIQRDILNQAFWIIEGTYLSSSDERLNAADTIIFLDMPRLLCLYRVLSRRIEYRKKPRPDLPEGCPEKLRLPYLLKVLVFPERGRKLFLKKIRETEKMTTELFWLKSNDDVEAFLRTLADLHSVQPVLAAALQKQPAFQRKVSNGPSLLDSLLESLGSVGAHLPLV